MGFQRLVSGPRIRRGAGRPRSRPEHFAREIGDHPPHIRHLLNRRDLGSVIPAKAQPHGRKPGRPPARDRHACRRPKLIEGRLGWRKQPRRIATRLNTSAVNSQAMLEQAMIQRDLRECLPLAACSRRGTKPGDLALAFCLSGLRRRFRHPDPSSGYRNGPAVSCVGSSGENRTVTKTQTAGFTTRSFHFGLRDRTRTSHDPSNSPAESASGRTGTVAFRASRSAPRTPQTSMVGGVNYQLLYSNAPDFAAIGPISFGVARQTRSDHKGWQKYKPCSTRYNTSTTTGPEGSRPPARSSLSGFSLE
jgi:hypothetical protein